MSVLFSECTQSTSVNACGSPVASELALYIDERDFADITDLLAREYNTLSASKLLPSARMKGLHDTSAAAVGYIISKPAVTLPHARPGLSLALMIKVNFSILLSKLVWQNDGSAEGPCRVSQHTCGHLSWLVCFNAVCWKCTTNCRWMVQVRTLNQQKCYAQSGSDEIVTSPPQSTGLGGMKTLIWDQEYHLRATGGIQVCQRQLDCFYQPCPCIRVAPAWALHHDGIRHCLAKVHLSEGD
jgi:hypothetical protein